METPHRHLLLPQSALDDLVATAGVAAAVAPAFSAHYNALLAPS